MLRRYSNSRESGEAARDYDMSSANTEKISVSKLEKKIKRIFRNKFKTKCWVSFSRYSNKCVIDLDENVRVELTFEDLKYLLEETGYEHANIGIESMNYGGTDAEITLW